jgi:hypothetical protein
MRIEGQLKNQRTGRAKHQARTGKQARTTAITLAVCLALLTALLGYLDGTGLFAPENWLDAGLLPSSATSPAWATLTFLPILVIASAAGLYLTVRAARPGVRARWVLGAAWSGVVLTAFLTKILYSLLLLAVAGPQALHLMPTLAAVLAESGLTGAKYAFFGVFAAGPAALAYLLSARRSARRARRDETFLSDVMSVIEVVDPSADAGPAAAEAAERENKHRKERVLHGSSLLTFSPVWLLAGVLAATAVADSSYPWLEGRSLLFVLPGAGFFGTLGAMRLIWPRVSAGLANRDGAAAWWVRVTVTAAATAIGFLLAFVVSGLIDGFGGGLYPVVGVLMHLAAGVTAAAVACLLGLMWDAAQLAWRPLGALADRVRASRSARYTLTAAAAVLMIGIDLAPAALASAPVSFPVPNAPSADGGGLLALTVLRESGKSPVIGDSLGRQVLLRGVNVNQLVDYGQPDKTKPTVRPLGESDYAQMASEYGFNVQRLNLSWSALEPARGQFSQAYIARVRQAVNWAASHGIYTVLDMHQDTYSKYVTATPGTACRIGASPEFGNDGAPAWATLTGGAKGCGFQGRDLSPNVEQSFTNLYDNTNGIGGEFAAAWGELAHSFAGDTAVAGYDLLNEPGPGNSPGVTSAPLLGRLYQQVISSVRSAESTAPGGYHHLVVFEPSILWSGLGFDVTPPVGFSGDPDLVFSPHLYSQSITMDQGLGVTLVTIEQGFAMAERTAAAYGVPLWSGEWGWFGSAASVGGPFDRFLNAQNANELGSAIWVWKKACGDPQSSSTDTVEGGINLYSCATGKDLPSPNFQTIALNQAYPRSAPGRLSSLSSSPTGVDLSLAGSGSGVLDVWIPGSARPQASATGLRNVALTAQPGGGWRLTADAAGAYSLNVR